MNELESKVYSKLMSVLEDTSYENDILKTTIWQNTSSSIKFKIAKF